MASAWWNDLPRTKVRLDFSYLISGQIISSTFDRAYAHFINNGYFKGTIEIEGHLDCAGKQSKIFHIPAEDFTFFQFTRPNEHAVVLHRDKLEARS